MADIDTSVRASFNLIDEPWINVQTPDGDATVSIRQIFDGSMTIYKIVGDSPTQDYAVLRLPLAIYWRAHSRALAELLSNRRQAQSFSWPAWFEEHIHVARESQRDDVVLEYLDTVHDRFDLFDAEHPFMQVPDLQTLSGVALGIARIIPEAENDLFTMRTASGRASLSPAEAARWLLHLQAYDYSGIKPGAVGDPRVKSGRGYPIGTGWTGMTGGTVVKGMTLLETLVLNTTPAVLQPSETEDLPAWERPTDTAQQRTVDVPQPTGAIDLATWQARRVRLFVEEGQVTSLLVTNGDKIPDAGKNILQDPMTPYRFSPNQTRKGVLAYYPQQYDTNRTMWRALDALVVTDNDPGFTEKLRPPIRPATLHHLAELAGEGVIDGVLDIQIVSMGYGSNNAVVETITSAEIGIPLQILRSNAISDALRQDVRDAAAVTSEAAKALGIFAGQLLTASGADYAFGADAADRLFALLQPHFIAWIREVGSTDPEKHVTTWQQRVKEEVLTAADELIRGAGPRAIIGRVTGDEDGSNQRIVSAATVHATLMRKLEEILPLAGRKDKREGEANE